MPARAPFRGNDAPEEPRAPIEAGTHWGRCKNAAGEAPPEWSVAGLLISGMAALALLFAGVAGWGFGVRISAAVTATGVAEVRGGGHVVQHPDGGVVAALYVAEGDQVSAGEVLLRLDDSRLAAEHAVVAAQLDELSARRTRLVAERDGDGHVAFAPELAARAAGPGDAAARVAEQMAGQAALFAERMEIRALLLAQLDRDARHYGRQIEATDTQIRAVARQQGLIAEELAAQEALLERGLSQAARVLALRREAARLEGLAGALAAERERAMTGMVEAAAQRSAVEAERRERLQAELHDLALREIELAEQKSELARRLAQLELRARHGGVVHRLEVAHAGAVVRPAEALMRIVPAGLPPAVLLRVDPSDIAALHEGQAVDLVFPALRGHGEHEARGRVVMIAADTFTDPQSRATYYRVEVELHPSDQDAAALPILPGMSVEAFILTGTRRPADYILQPVTDNLRRAMRDG